MRGQSPSVGGHRRFGPLVARAAWHEDRRIEIEEFFAQFFGRRDVALRGLAIVVELRRTLDRIEGALAAEAYAGGAPWAQIGAQLGISRQAAFMRHRARVKQTDGDSPRPFC